MLIFQNANFTVSILPISSETAALPLLPERYGQSDALPSVCGRAAAAECFAAYYRQTFHRQPSEDILAGLRVCAARSGKPYIANAPGFFYNVTHSGDYAAAVFSKTGEVGIDLQKIVPYRLRLAERMLTEAENAVLRQLTGHSRDERFTLYWTKKEAMVKAGGYGLFAKQSAANSFGQILSFPFPSGYWMSIALQVKP